MEQVAGTHYLYGNLVNSLMEETHKWIWWDFRRFIDNSIYLNAKLVDLSAMNAFRKFNTSIEDFQRKITKIEKQKSRPARDKSADYLEAAKSVNLDALKTIASECAKDFQPFQKYHWKWISSVFTMLLAIGGIMFGAGKWLISWPQNNA